VDQDYKSVVSKVVGGEGGGCERVVAHSLSYPRDLPQKKETCKMDSYSTLVMSWPGQVTRSKGSRNPR